MTDFAPDQAISPSQGPGKVMDITPDKAEWTYLSFAVVELTAGESFEQTLDDQETAVVPLSGTFELSLGDQTHSVGRSSVFEELAPVGYAPPRTSVGVTATTDCSFSIGSAAAEGKYPARLIPPTDIRSEIRGGGAAYRQVNHTLAYPIEAERLILYEVYVPRGTWSGWAPHCHDGREGSPYLEEVYYFRMDRPEGFWMQRNWRDSVDPAEDFQELMRGSDGEAALVRRGYHSSVACPGSNMYFLNYLAGELTDEDRKTPPCFSEVDTWIHDDWNAGAWTLPVIDLNDPTESDPAYRTSGASGDSTTS